VDKCVKFAHDNDDDEFEPDPSWQLDFDVVLYVMQWSLIWSS
jgi:hypothetical protein